MSLFTESEGQVCAYLQQTDLYPEVAEREASACGEMGGGRGRLAGGRHIHLPVEK